MTATMETWIVADPIALRSFYGQHLSANKLPVHNNLEKVAKADILRYLEAATKDTQPGVYHKMKHAPKLLSRMNPVNIRQACLHCNRLFQAIETAIQP